MGKKGSKKGDATSNPVARKTKKDAKYAKRGSVSSTVDEIGAAGTDVTCAEDGAGNNADPMIHATIDLFERKIAKLDMLLKSYGYDLNDKTTDEKLEILKEIKTKKLKTVSTLEEEYLELHSKSEELDEYFEHVYESLNSDNGFASKQLAEIMLKIYKLDERITKLNKNLNAIGGAELVSKEVDGKNKSSFLSAMAFVFDKTGLMSGTKHERGRK